MRLSLALLMLSMTVILTACSDDNTTTNNGTNTTNNNGAPTCPDGQRYNVVLGRCQVISDNNSNNNNNNQPDDMGGTTADMDMASAPDMVTPADMSSPVDMNVPDQMTSEPDMMVACGVGSIKGRACAPSGEPVSGATVTISGTDCRTGQPFTRTLTTDRNGSYEAADLPSGTLDITVSTGGSFNRSFFVTLQPGDDVDLTTQTSKYCLEANAVKIAVIGGLFDHVEGVLDDLAFEYDIKGNDVHQNDLSAIRRQYPTATAQIAQTVAFLSDLNALEQYDVVFINCGILWDSLTSYHASSIPTIISNRVCLAGGC